MLVLEDYQGDFTAVLLEDYDNVGAVGTSVSEVLEGMRDYLDWVLEEGGGGVPADFQDPRLLEIHVEIRPEYQVGERVYPCVETVSLKIPCVVGTEANGLLICAIPTLDIRFNFNDMDSIRNLVNHYVKRELQGLTPSELALRASPKSVFLDWVSVKARQESEKEGGGDFESRNCPILSSVADAVSHPKIRRNRFSPAWERGKVVQNLVDRLLNDKNSVILVGETGVGKTTVFVEAAKRIAKHREEDDDEETGLEERHFRVWLTSGARIISGMQYLGQWEERCEEIIEELSSFDGILGIENLYELVFTEGGERGGGIASFLTPYLRRGELLMVIEATPLELDRCRRLVPGFIDLFQILPIPNLSLPSALKVIHSTFLNLERIWKIQFDEGLAEIVYRLFQRFLPYQTFPGRSIPFLKALAEKCAGQTGLVRADDVFQRFGEWSGMPVNMLRDDVPLEFAEIERAFGERILGQEEACRIVAHVVAMFKAGLNDPNRPVAVLLFCGPSGVGKTAMARFLSQYLFGHGELEKRLIRLDMSEYGMYDAAERLLYDPKGGPATWIKTLRQQPFSVLLLDEIEKADPKVFDIFLNVFDEGTLTDPYGRTTYFRSSIILMTSNLGAEKQDSLGFGPPQLPPYESIVEEFFRLELINRIDEIVVFSPLRQDIIMGILRKELTDIQEREGIHRLNLRLEWTDELLEHLARHGFDRMHGARPLQRVIEQEIVSPLARYLLEHSGLRDRTLVLDWLSGRGLSICSQEEWKANQKLPIQDELPLS